MMGSFSATASRARRARRARWARWARWARPSGPLSPNLGPGESSAHLDPQSKLPLYSVDDTAPPLPRIN